MKPVKTVKRARKRKGSLEETISYAMYKDDPAFYLVTYRDRDLIKTATLKDFFSAEEFTPIPTTRILQLSKKGKIVWKKGQKEILVKV